MVLHPGGKHWVWGDLDGREHLGGAGVTPPGRWQGPSPWQGLGPQQVHAGPRSEVGCSAAQGAFSEGQTAASCRADSGFPWAKASLGERARRTSQSHVSRDRMRGLAQTDRPEDKCDTVGRSDVREFTRWEGTLGGVRWCWGWDCVVRSALVFLSRLLACSWVA